MANPDAFNAGFQKGMGKSSKNKDEDKDANKLGKDIPAMHKGGKVKRTGNYRLRKKEVVLTVAQQKAAGLKKGKRKSSARKRVASKR